MRTKYSPTHLRSLTALQLLNLRTQIESKLSRTENGSFKPYNDSEWSLQADHAWVDNIFQEKAEVNRQAFNNQKSR